MRRQVRLKWAESPKPAASAASVSERPVEISARLCGI
jgi:hypothetical protein